MDESGPTMPSSIAPPPPGIFSKTRESLRRMVCERVCRSGLRDSLFHARRFVQRHRQDPSNVRLSRATSERMAWRGRRARTEPGFRPRRMLHPQGARSTTSTSCHCCAVASRQPFRGAENGLATDRRSGRSRPGRARRTGTAIVWTPTRRLGTVVRGFRGEKRGAEVKDLHSDGRSST